MRGKNAKEGVDDLEQRDQSDFNSILIACYRPVVNFHHELSKGIIRVGNLSIVDHAVCDLLDLGPNVDDKSFNRFCQIYFRLFGRLSLGSERCCQLNSELDILALISVR